MVAENDKDLLDGEPYALLMQFYAAMRNDADATRHWVEEHKRRYREEFKGDKFRESQLRLRYASNLAMAGLYDEAVEELRIMVEEPGGHRFPYFHGLPEFEVLHDHPGYTQLRAKFGNADSAPTE